MLVSIAIDWKYNWNHLLKSFFFFWLHWVFVAACGLSPVAESGGFSCCGAWALGVRASAVVAHGLSCSVACGSSRTRARTCIPCTGRRILNQCATREVPPTKILISRIHHIILIIYGTLSMSFDFFLLCKFFVLYIRNIVIFYFQFKFFVHKLSFSFAHT